jgi:hypothetical protein
VAKKGPSGRGIRQAPAETPTSSAKLGIRLSKTGGSARANVPPSEARHTVTAFSILGTTWAGIGGAVLTVRISPGLSGLALAELGLTLAVAVILALLGRRSNDQR